MHLRKIIQSGFVLILSIFCFNTIEAQVSTYPTGSGQTVTDRGKTVEIGGGGEGRGHAYVDCEEFPDVCDKIRDKWKPKEPDTPANPNPKEPGEDGGGKDSGGKDKEKKKKKQSLQTESWPDVPNFKALGLEGGLYIKQKNGKWTAVKDPNKFLKIVFKNF